MADRGRSSLVIELTTRLTFPIVLLLAAEDVINAPAAPGEGFSGGLLTALAILLLFVGLGYEPVERMLPVFGRKGLLTGIGLALASGLLGFLTPREAFLASTSIDPVLLGKGLHLSTHVLFDLAIFLVVSSGVLAIFRAIGGREEEAP